MNRDSGWVFIVYMGWLLALATGIIIFAAFMAYHTSGGGCTTVTVQ